MALIVVILFIAATILVTAALSRYKDEIPTLFGYSLHIVVTDSMSPEINEGDFVLAKQTDINEVETGDYVVYDSPDPTLEGKVIIHSVLAIGEDENGRYLTTAGIREGAVPDRYPVREISGRYVYSSAFIGKVFSFMTDFRNLMFLAVTTGALFIAVKYSIKVAVQIKNKRSSNE